MPPAHHPAPPPQAPLWLPQELWVRVAGWSKSVSDLWALTSTCSAAHQARLDPALPAAWLVRQKGVSQAAVSAVRSGLSDATVAAILKHALRLGADPNAASAKLRGRPPVLLLAAAAGLNASTAALLAGGGRVNEIDEGGSTAIQCAAYQGHGDVVRTLVAAGADLDAARGERAASPLVAAAYTGRLEVVTLLLAIGANPNATSPNGAAPLSFAAEKGHTAVVRALLDAGADPNLARHDLVTPLFIAASSGHVDAVRALLAGGANPRAPRANGATALARAAHLGHAEVVKVLLPGASPVEVQTAMCFAGEHPEVVALLVKAGGLVYTVS